MLVLPSITSRCAWAFRFTRTIAWYISACAVSAFGVRADIAFVCLCKSSYKGSPASWFSMIVMLFSSVSSITLVVAIDQMIGIVHRDTMYSKPWEKSRLRELTMNHNLLKRGKTQTNSVIQGHCHLCRGNQVTSCLCPHRTCTRHAPPWD